MKKNIKSLFIVLAFSGSTIAQGDTLQKMEDYLANLPPEKSAFVSLKASINLTNKFQDLIRTAPKEDRLWAIKTLAGGQWLLHKVSPESSPFKECFLMSYKVTAAFVRGDGRSLDALQEKYRDVDVCMRAGVSSMERKYKLTQDSSFSMTKEDHDFSDKIISMAMFLASQKSN